MKTPYPWFGGKQMVAGTVWDALGDVALYVEPFFGGGAVLLNRPADHRIRREVINDMDGFVVNFWRAVKHDPAGVAEHADWPVHEVDILARQRYLCEMPRKDEFLGRMKENPDLYDVKFAGYWAWGLSAWLGNGWCGGEWWPDETAKCKGAGMRRGAKYLPSIRLRGVHRKSQDVGEYISELSTRMRHVIACCGDWHRVVTRGVLSDAPTVGVFCDPPYHGGTGRDKALYRVEDLTVADDVRAWCVEHGDDGALRIVLAGYEGEHDELERDHGWRCVAWTARGGMGNHGKANSKGKSNRKRERLWMSPSCLVADEEATG